VRLSVLQSLYSIRFLNFEFQIFQNFALAFSARLFGNNFCYKYTPKILALIPQQTAEWTFAYLFIYPRARVSVCITIIIQSIRFLNFEFQIFQNFALAFSAPFLETLYILTSKGSTHIIYICNTRKQQYVKETEKGNET